MMKIFIFSLLMLSCHCVSTQTQESNSTSYYYQHWCDADGPTSLEYLDDSRCQKQFPSSFSRDWQCRTLSSDLSGFYPDGPIESIFVNTSGIPAALKDALALLNWQAIVVRRDAKGQAYYKYVASGSQQEAWETWSSSKIFAVANAAGRLREEGGCSFGLNGATTGEHGMTPLGDLQTIITSYDTTQGYTSNGLAAYFQNVGNRSRLDAFVQQGLQQGPSQTLGGNYGEPVPSDLGYKYVDYAVPQDQRVCSVVPDLSGPVFQNHISAFTAAELTRRIVLFRETIPENRFPGEAWTDVQDQLYGADPSLLFPGLQWGGMSTDTAIFLQAAINMTQVSQQSLGHWRIFSKLGAGYSTSRDRGEITYNSYACLPVLDPSTLDPSLNQGLEFVISARSSVPYDTSLKQAQAIMHQGINAIVHYLQSTY